MGQWELGLKQTKPDWEYSNYPVDPKSISAFSLIWYIDCGVTNYEAAPNAERTKAVQLDFGFPLQHSNSSRND